MGGHRQFFQSLRCQCFDDLHIVHMEMLSVLPKQFHRLRFSLNGIDMHRFRQSGDFHRHGSGAAADIIDYGSICQVQLANTDFPDFFLGHRSSAKFSLRPGSIP